MWGGTGISFFFSSPTPPRTSLLFTGLPSRLQFTCHFWHDLGVPAQVLLNPARIAIRIQSHFRTREKKNETSASPSGCLKFTHKNECQVWLRAKQQRLYWRGGESSAWVKCCEEYILFYVEVDLFQTFEVFTGASASLREVFAVRLK